jgi:TolC family type I secretion outer membrane protein
MKSFPCFFGMLLLPLVFSEAARAEYVTLEQTLVEAYQNNPSLEAQRAQLRATDEQVALALSHWRPTLEATTSVGKTYQRIPDLQPFDEANYAAGTTSYGAQITQPLFRGFRTLAETEAAKKQVKAGRAQLQVAEQTLLLNVATAFLDVLRDEFILKADRDNEVVLGKRLDETTTLARKGELTRTDVEQAQSRLARAEAGTLQTENTLQADRDAFTRLVGHEPGSLATPDMSPNGLKNLNDILHLAETRNPSVIAAQYTLEQSDADIKDNKGSLLPELDFVGSTSRNYGQSAITPGRYDSSAVMLQLKIPLYEAGADHARIRAAQQTSVQYRMELEEIRHRVHETARNAWQALATTDATIKADKREIEAAANALKGVEIQARAGTRTTLDVLNAEQELLDAKTDLAKSEHDRTLAILQIRSSIGELTADALKLPLVPYDPKKYYDDNHARWVGFGGADDDIYAKPREQETDTQ